MFTTLTQTASFLTTHAPVLALGGIILALAAIVAVPMLGGRRQLAHDVSRDGYRPCF